MRAWPVIALFICSVNTGAIIADDPRGARRVAPALFDLQRLTDFDSAGSAGLFVGVQKFTQDDTLAEIPCAVDDAIDLAYLFALELELVRPGRVVLLLSGEARKPASRERLSALGFAEHHQDGRRQILVIVLYHDTLGHSLLSFLGSDGAKLALLLFQSRKVPLFGNQGPQSHGADTDLP